MSIILDLIILAIIIFFIISSAKRGFVKVLVETVGFIAAIVAAFTISTPLASATYDKIIEPPVIKAAVEAADENAGKEALNALPDFLTDNGLRLFGTAADTFTDKIKENMSEGVQTAAKTASQEIVKPAAVKLLSLLYSVILVIILMIAVKFLAKLLNGVFSFSIIGKLNRMLGGVVGAVKGSVIAFIFCMTISLLICFTGKDFWIFTAKNIDNSYIFKFFTEIFSIK